MPLDDEAIARWKDAARILARVARPLGDGGSRVGIVTRITRYPRDYPDMFPDRWTDDTSRFVASKGGRGVDGLIMRLAHAVAMNDPGAVRPADRKWLAWALGRAALDGPSPPDRAAFREELARLSREADAARAAIDPRAPVPELFPFAFTYAERRGTGSREVVGEGLATMREAGPGPHPVVAVLTTDHGREVTIIDVGGEPYRAVFRPSSWEPVGVREFVEAAREGGPWRDAPFLAPSHHLDAANGVHELGEAPGRWARRPPWRRPAPGACAARARSS